MGVNRKCDKRQNATHETTRKKNQQTAERDHKKAISRIINTACTHNCIMRNI